MSGYHHKLSESAQMLVLYTHCPVSAAPIPLNYTHRALSGIWEKSDISHTTDIPISNSKEQKRLPTAGTDKQPACSAPVDTGPLAESHSLSRGQEIDPSFLTN